MGEGGTLPHPPIARHTTRLRRQPERRGAAPPARPAWLAHLHPALDRAVWAAYGWGDPDPAAVAEDAILARLLALNGARSEPKRGTHPASGAE